MRRVLCDNADGDYSDLAKSIQCHIQCSAAYCLCKNPIKMNLHVVLTTPFPNKLAQLHHLKDFQIAALVIH